MTDGKGALCSNTSIFERITVVFPKIAVSSQPYMCKPFSVRLRGHHVSRPHNTGSEFIVAPYQQDCLCPRDKAFLYISGLFTMSLTQLNRECLLHLFSFLDKDSRRNLSLACRQLREVYLDPCLWNLLHFSSPCQLRWDNYVLGPSLRYLTICWYSSRVQLVCNIEDWLKTSFQKDICSKHESLVSTFLAHVCHMCPNLLTLTLSGCAHITDQEVVSVLQCCKKLRSLRLENCVRITDRSLQAIAEHGDNLEEVRVDFCRNITQTGLQSCKEMRPIIQLSAERSADMIPDIKPEEKEPLGKALQKFLLYS